MAIIGNIRKKSGIVIIIIGVALAAFVLGDFVRKGPERGNDIGIIAGEAITHTDFESRVQKQEEQYKQQSGKENLSSAEILQIREMTWSQLVRETIMQKEYDKLGVKVGKDELFDLVQGKHIHPYIVQSFTDPQTGQFNPATVVQFIKTLDQREPEVKDQWLKIEKAIKMDRLTQKYNNLVAKSFYLPKALAEKELQVRTENVSTRVFALNYRMVDDKTITLTDDDYKKFYDDHKYQYDQKESRGLDYVIFDVAPSPEDKDAIQKQVLETYNNFLKEEDLKNYVNAVSDTKFDSTYHKSGTLSPRIDSALFNATPGRFTGPFIEDKTWKMAKLVDVQSRPDSIMASHILIAYRGSNLNANVARSKDDAEKTADSILNVLKKSPDQFNNIVMNMSDFPQAKQDTGNLKWMKDGDPNFALFFNKSVSLNPGEFKVIESGLGYHVLKVTAKTKPVKKVQVAVIERNIEPSNTTFKEIYTIANKFAAENDNEAAFLASVQKQGLNKRQAEIVQKSDLTLPGLESAREIIRWAYNNESKKGNVAMFDLAAENKYVVALLTNIREKGIPPLEDIKKNLEPLVVREKKAEVLIGKINTALNNTKDIYTLASQLKTKVDTLTNISFFSYNLPLYGPEPEVIGNLFSMKKGEMSGPVKGANGVFVAIVDNINKPMNPADLPMVIQQLGNEFGSKAGNLLFNALEESSDIEDNRILFY